ncbi:uncharacterized protein LOC132258444 [Phlebotomus argentipes]|uniref:uncharacterized protein LOC132258444 n=1 Tax=Phlebotomus argentipes TaxID=94469 RepID=UPI0028930640|nr:uncharacterized protein LOC132258444 [Phlebotomus argentipes]
MAEESFVIFGGPCPIDYTVNNESLAEYAFKSLKANGNEVAIIDGASGEIITYSALLDRALTLLKYLQKKGIGSGDIIGICCENRLEFPVVALATIFAGATLSTLNPRYVNREIKHVLDLTTPKLVFVTSSALGSIMEVSKGMKCIKEIIQIGNESDARVSGIARFDEILRDPKYRMSQEEFQLPSTSSLDAQDAFILMSSGTTGIPKGVVLSDRNVLEALANLEETKRSMFTMSNVCTMSILPWFHTFGLVTLVFFITKRVKIVSLSRFDEKTFLSSIQQYKISHFFLVPPLMIFLAKNPNVQNYDLSSVKELFCGAAPLGKDIEDEIKQRIPSLTEIQQAYGMTEATLALTGARNESPIEGSVGKIIAKTWCKVVDPETGKALGPNKPGEICVKGPSVMKGYYKNPKATQETIRNGWLHTGDIGYYDEKKNFYIVDRLKELIKYNSFQVAPAELEALILTHSAVKDTAVIGIPHPVAGELPAAFVVKKENYEATAEDIAKFVSDRVSNPKRLRGGVHFVDEIPKNPSGKILRRVLRDRIASVKSKL